MSTYLFSAKIDIFIFYFRLKRSKFYLNILLAVYQDFYGCYFRQIYFKTVELFSFFNCFQIFFFILPIYHKSYKSMISYNVIVAHGYRKEIIRILLQNRTF